MHALRFILLLFLIIAFSLNSYSQDRGIIEGRVYNAKNNNPVEFATVAIFGTTIGSISDLDGKFLFTGIKPGFVELRVSSVGFDTYISEPILVTNANKVFIDIPMVEAKIQLEEITIKASPFRRIAESPVSLRRIDIRDIEKNPGGNRDISKIIQSYPGVASTPSFRNDVIVRGGGASENRFYLDGVEIPNINHFATQGASGGPVGIINVDFIREVNFLSGAFPASRGNALSSIIDFRLIDGNADKLKFKGSVGASDLALTLDGPLSENTTFIVSARRSYLQFLFSIIGLPFLPTYNDFQFKTKTKINDKNELTILGIGAIDQFALNFDANETEQQQYILGYLPVNEQWNYAMGAVWKHFGENGFDTWVLSRNFLNNRAYKYQDNMEVDSLKLIDYISDEIENKFRYERSNDYSNGLKLVYGTGVEFVKYNNSTFQKVFRNDISQELSYDTKMELFKWGLFGQVSQNFLKDRLTLSAGLRADANNYSPEMSNMLDQLSPRVSASYLLDQDFYLNFNAGRYYQTPSYTTLGYKDFAGNLVNKNNGLKYIQSDHLVAGIEWLPDESSRLTVEGFFKYYQNYPFSISDSISLSSKGADFGVFGDEAVKSTGINRSYGMEVLYRNRDLLGSNLIMSYTLVRSETQSFRSDLAGGAKWVPTSWDNRHILNITTTREFRKNWRGGFKWRFVGGTPYTPYDLEFSSLRQAWDIRNQGYLDYSRFNSQRLRSFHQLDVRIDKEWFLNKLTINLYVDVQNVYNFKAEEQKILILNNPQPTPADPLRYSLKELDLQAGTVLPTIGIIVEF
jgi:hypothetical protein